MFDSKKSESNKQKEPRKQHLSCRRGLKRWCHPESLQRTLELICICMLALYDEFDFNLLGCTVLNFYCLSTISTAMEEHGKWLSAPLTSAVICDKASDSFIHHPVSFVTIHAILLSDSWWSDTSGDSLRHRQTAKHTWSGMHIKTSAVLCCLSSLWLLWFPFLWINPLHSSPLQTWNHMWKFSVPDVSDNKHNY